MKPKTYLLMCIGLIILAPVGYGVLRVLGIPFTQNIPLYSMVLGIPLGVGLILIKIGVITGILFKGEDPR